MPYTKVKALKIDRKGLKYVEMIALNNDSKSTLNYKHLALALLVACTPLTVQQSYAQLQLEIAKAPDQAPQIAVVPFGNDQTVSPIVASDLNRSGRFTSTSNNLPANPTSPSQMNVGVWKGAGIPYVVMGT